jgi:hypothetical protein
MKERYADLVHAAATLLAFAPGHPLPPAYFDILGRAIGMKRGGHEFAPRAEPGAGLAPITDAVIDDVARHAIALRRENAIEVMGTLGEAMMKQATARLAAPKDLTVAEAAQMCGRSEQTIVNWIEKNPQLGRFDKASRRYWVSRSALMEFWTKRFGADTLPAALLS